LLSFKKNFIETALESGAYLGTEFFIKFWILPRKSLGALFKIIESEKVNLGIRKYALSETSLEQVFHSVVADQATLDTLE